MGKKVIDKLDLTAKTIAEEMAENKATAEQALSLLGRDSKKGLTKRTRDDILNTFTDIVKRGGGLTGEQTAEVVRATRVIALEERLAKGDMEGALWVADKIATDPATGLTKANGVEVTVNIPESLQNLMGKEVHDIFKIEEKQDDGK